MVTTQNEATANRPATTRHFQTRDTRLPGEPHPIVTKSVDVTATCRERGRQQTVRLDYGYDAESRLWVEIAVYKPSEDAHWVYYPFDVLKLIGGSEEHPESLEILARILGVSTENIIAHARLHAPPLPS